jgi:opacity protein-like surface antigen
MKRLILLITAVCLLAGTAFTADLYPIFGGGVKVGNAGRPVFAAFGGANVPLATNEAKDYQFFNRSQIFYDNTFGPETVSGQGLTSFLMMRKAINAPDPGQKSPFTEIEVNAGVGLKYMIDEGKDSKNAVIKLESGATVWKSFRLMAGVDYQPSMPNDVWYPYLALDLSPRL